MSSSSLNRQQYLRDQAYRDTFTKSSSAAQLLNAPSPSRTSNNNNNNTRLQKSSSVISIPSNNNSFSYDPRSRNEQREENNNNNTPKNKNDNNISTVELLLARSSSTSKGAGDDDSKAHNNNNFSADDLLDVPLLHHEISRLTSTLSERDQLIRQFQNDLNHQQGVVKFLTREVETLRKQLSVATATAVASIQEDQLRRRSPGGTAARDEKSGHKIEEIKSRKMEEQIHSFTAQRLQMEREAALKTFEASTLGDQLKDKDKEMERLEKKLKTQTEEAVKLRSNNANLEAEITILKDQHQQEQSSHSSTADEFNKFKSQANKDLTEMMRALRSSQLKQKLEDVDSGLQKDRDERNSTSSSTPMTTKESGTSDHNSNSNQSSNDDGNMNFASSPSLSLFSKLSSSASEILKSMPKLVESGIQTDPVEELSLPSKKEEEEKKKQQQKEQEQNETPQKPADALTSIKSAAEIRRAAILGIITPKKQLEKIAASNEAAGGASPEKIEEVSEKLSKLESTIEQVENQIRETLEDHLQYRNGMRKSSPVSITRRRVEYEKQQQQQQGKKSLNTSVDDENSRRGSIDILKTPTSSTSRKEEADDDFPLATTTGTTSSKRNAHREEQAQLDSRIKRLREQLQLSNPNYRPLHSITGDEFTDALPGTPQHLMSPYQRFVESQKRKQLLNKETAKTEATQMSAEQMTEFVLMRHNVMRELVLRKEAEDRIDIMNGNSHFTLSIDFQLREQLREEIRKVERKNIELAKINELLENQKESILKKLEEERERSIDLVRTVEKTKMDLDSANKSIEKERKKFQKDLEEQHDLKKLFRLHADAAELGLEESTSRMELMKNNFESYIDFIERLRKASQSLVISEIEMKMKLADEEEEEEEEEEQQQKEKETTKQQEDDHSPSNTKQSEDEKKKPEQDDRQPTSSTSTSIKNVPSSSSPTSPKTPTSPILSNTPPVLATRRRRPPVVAPTSKLELNNLKKQVDFLKAELEQEKIKYSQLEKRTQKMTKIATFELTTALLERFVNLCSNREQFAAMIEDRKLSMFHVMKSNLLVAPAGVVLTSFSSSSLRKSTVSFSPSPTRNNNNPSTNNNADDRYLSPVSGDDNNDYKTSFSPSPNTKKNLALTTSTASSLPSHHNHQEDLSTSIPATSSNPFHLSQNELAKTIKFLKDNKNNADLQRQQSAILSIRAKFSVHFDLIEQLCEFYADLQWRYALQTFENTGIRSIESALRDLDEVVSDFEGSVDRASNSSRNNHGTDNEDEKNGDDLVSDDRARNSTSVATAAPTSGSPSPAKRSRLNSPSEARSEFSL